MFVGVQAADRDGGGDAARGEGEGEGAGEGGAPARAWTGGPAASQNAATRASRVAFW
jgi:hypothetical protein